MDPASPPVKLKLPLPFQQDLFHEIWEEDRLVILARGLGLLQIVSNLLHSYDAAGDNLVLLVGANENENEWIGTALAEHAEISGIEKAKGLHIITTESATSSARQKQYLKGGIFSVTSRILITDLLTGNIKAGSIAGIVALHADRIIATSTEAFILRIYRQQNKDGFIKAFSDNPESFTTGFAPLATMMRNLYLRTPSLWPRFQTSVAESLESKKAEVVEVNVSMTDAMVQIQTAILQCIEVSLSELKKANARELDMEDWNVESALHKSFDVIIRRQLDPVWHRVSYRTRQIVGDLGDLRNMLGYLLAYDCVMFQQYLDRLIAASAPVPGSTRQTQSPWLFLDAAQNIFTVAKNRVYTGKVEGKGTNPNGVPKGLRPVLEESPKWDVLYNLLEEIERDMRLNPSPRDDSSSDTILIMTADLATSRQIREYLNSREPFEGGYKDIEDDEPQSVHSVSPAAYMMRRKLRSYLAWKREFKTASNNLFSENARLSVDGPKRGQDSFRGRGPPANKRRRVRGGGTLGLTSSKTTGAGVQIPEDKTSDVVDLEANIQPTGAEQNLKPEIAFDPLDNFDKHYRMLPLREIVTVREFGGDGDDRLLDQLKPRYVIMYSPDATFIRRVEMHRSSHGNRTIKIYFMYFGDSVEEQRYLSAVRKEKDAFSKLIREKGTMTVTLTAEGKGIENPQEQFLRTVNTRVAGGGRLTATAEPPKVIVDIREFRSSLPSLLHGRYTTIVPETLIVGDYILSPDICVERKSISDLISSFKDGRLYAQCEAMTRYYKQPMVLIEFDQNKSFILEPFADMTSTFGQHDLQSKLVLLAIAFPRVKFIWSSSPYQTAEIFEELKKNHEEPDVAKAPKVGLGEDDDPKNRFNEVPQKMLAKVPGITSGNERMIMSSVDDMIELSNMEEKEIAELIGTEAAKKVWKFFNRSVFKR